MKRNMILCAVVAMMYAATPTMLTASTMPNPQSQQQSSEKSDGWIEIGEIEAVFGSTRYKCTLYVRELGKRLVYRVRYSGGYYTVIPHDGQWNARFDVDRRTYFLNVPTW